MLVVGAGLFGIFLFLSYYLQQTLGYSPLVTGATPVACEATPNVPVAIDVAITMPMPTAVGMSRPITPAASPPQHSPLASSSAAWTVGGLVAIHRKKVRGVHLSDR
jgi:hypothetical protein